MGEIVEGASDGAPVGLPQVAAAGAAGAPVEADGGLAARCADALQNWTPPKRPSIGKLSRFYNFDRLSREIPTFKHYHSEDSTYSESTRIELSSKSTTCFTVVIPLEVE